MINQIKNKLQTHRTLTIQLIFILIALIYSLVLIFIKHFYGEDSIFNYLRLKEVSLDITHGQFPQFNWFTGTVLGGAVNTFYPWLIMLPLIPFLYILSPLKWWILVTGCGIFIGLDITYFSAYQFIKKWHFAFWLAVIYCLSTVPFSEIYGQSDIGYFYGMMLTPLIFFGWQNWLKNYRWKELTLGLILVAYLNVAFLVTVILSLILLTVFFIQKLSKQKIVNLLKAISCVILGSTAVWLPMVILNFNNKIYLPSESTYDKTQYPLIFKNIIKYLIITSDNSWDIIDILALLFVIFGYHYLTKFDKKITLISLIILIINTYPINQFMLKHTIFSHLQFMHRFSFFSQFLLSIVFLDMLSRIYSQKSCKRILHSIFSFMMIVVLLGEFECGVVLIKDSNFTQNFHFSSYDHNLQLRYSYTSHDLNSKLGRHDLSIMYPDYYPKSFTHTFKKHNATHVRIRIPTPKLSNYSQQNHYLVKTKHPRWVYLPIALYHGQKYQITNNKKHIKARNHGNHLVVKLHRGINDFKLRTPVMWYRYVAIIISLFVVVSLLV